MAERVFTVTHAASSSSIEVPVDGLTFTGAASTWAAQNGIGGGASDDIKFTVPARGIFVGTAGTLKVRYSATQRTVTTPVIPAGTTLVGQFDKLFGDAGTAQDILVQF